MVQLHKHSSTGKRGFLKESLQEENLTGSETKGKQLFFLILIYTDIYLRSQQNFWSKNDKVDVILVFVFLHKLSYKIPFPHIISGTSLTNSKSTQMKWPNPKETRTNLLKVSGESVNPKSSKNYCHHQPVLGTYWRSRAGCFHWEQVRYGIQFCQQLGKLESSDVTLKTHCNLQKKATPPTIHSSCALQIIVKHVQGTFMEALKVGLIKGVHLLCHEEKLCQQY